MSKQTLESLEQSEKRVESAEKEVLILRDREASLRRRLMEHWSGVMAWEVRRLEKAHAEAQARYNRQTKQITAAADRERQFREQIDGLSSDLEARHGRVMELEEIVLELGRRERAIEDEVAIVENERAALEQEKIGWTRERQMLAQRQKSLEDEAQAFEKERSGWAAEKRMFAEERQRLMGEFDKLSETGKVSDKDKAILDQLRVGLGGVLGRKGLAETELVGALGEVRALMQRREKEVTALREEMKEVNMGLEEEVRRVSSDRDTWKAKAEGASQSSSTQVTALERQLRVSHFIVGSGSCSLSRPRLRRPLT